MFCRQTRRKSACAAPPVACYKLSGLAGGRCGERAIVAADCWGLFAVGLRHAALGQGRRNKKRPGARSSGLYAHAARTAAAGHDKRAGLSRLHDGAWLDAAIARQQQTIDRRCGEARMPESRFALDPPQQRLGMKQERK